MGGGTTAGTLFLKSHSAMFAISQNDGMSDGPYLTGMKTLTRRIIVARETQLVTTDSVVHRPSGREAFFQKTKSRI